MTTPNKSISCPNCDKPNTWQSTNPFRPFCSERCKLIDLGKWADDKNFIPGEPVNPENKKEEDED